MPTRDEPPSPHLHWDSDGLPRSSLFDDVYFSKDGGLQESEAVFLQGCGLPEAWAGRERFTLAELGFGTGLNIAALLDDPPLRSRIGAAGRERVLERFTWAACARRTVDVYRELVAC